MLSLAEREEIRQVAYDAIAELERQIYECAGSYSYLCLIDGAVTFTHHPVGRVLRYIPRPVA
jgi:hypothetical protein